MNIDPTAITSLGAILGALAGAITFLFKALITSKDDTIKLLTDDRNYWRGVAQGMSTPHPPSYPPGPGPGYPPYPQPPAA